MFSVENVSREDRDLIISLLRAGVSRYRIGQKMDLSYKQICKVLCDMGLDQQDMRLWLRQEYGLPVVHVDLVHRSGEYGINTTSITTKGRAKQPYALVIPYHEFEKVAPEILQLLKDRGII